MTSILARRIALQAKKVISHCSIYGISNTLRRVCQSASGSFRSAFGESRVFRLFRIGPKLPDVDSRLYSYILNDELVVDIGSDPYSITWIVPEYGPSSGGHRTIFRHIANLAKQGIASRLVILEVGNPFSIENAYKNLPPDLDLLGLKILMARDLDYLDSRLVVTSWHTAYWARSLAQNFKYKCFYFIQDYESQFYPSGSLSVLADSTYGMPYRHIYASSWLAKVVPGNTCTSKDSIVDLGVEPSEFSVSFDSLARRRDRILHNLTLDIGVYYRPVTDRRMHQHAELFLEYVIKKKLNLRLHFFGWRWTKLDFPSSSNWHKCHGMLNHSDISNLFESLDACLLFGSTNVSLMPLEAIASGLPTFVNGGRNNSCLLEHLPIYFSNTPELGFKYIEACLEDRRLLIDKMNAGIEGLKGCTWEASSILFKSILYEQ